MAEVQRRLECQNKPEKRVILVGEPRFPFHCAAMCSRTQPQTNINPPLRNFVYLIVLVFASVMGEHAVNDVPSAQGLRAAAKAPSRRSSRRSTACAILRPGICSERP